MNCRNGHRFGIILLILIKSHCCFSQKEANIWYFGYKIGLDFSQSPPALLLDGQIAEEGVTNSHMESSASISDANGKLLFYTNGMTVWNRLHEVMPNGTDLFGESTTTQTLIVPKPGSTTLYYIFTASPQGDHEFFPVERRGFRYSVIDMSEDSGLGDVIEKNTLLSVSTTEKMAATRHVNGTDVWVAMHEWNNNVFRSYLITEEGINPNPVYSQTGAIHSGPSTENTGNAIGQMKISPDGEKLALVLYIDRVLEVFDFNPTNGAIMSIGSVSFEEEIGLLYGLEFSPSSRYLYATNRLCHVFQLDLHAGLSREKVVKISRTPPCDSPAQLQLAPDGKIYIAQYSRPAIGAIHLPEVKGEGCEYEARAINIPLEYSRPCGQGLPNFISSYFLNTELYPLRPYFDMPNVFTPNDDGYNDRFVPMVNYNIASWKLIVYNRWGLPVFETMDIENGWNGGEHAPGVYYWMAQYRGVNGKDYAKKGFVQLVR
jgi:gliding motility-associated-like protein